jgi:hypothetical protein
MTTAIQTVTLSLGIDIADKSVRAEASARFGIMTNGNFDKKDKLLEVDAVYTTTEIPPQVFLLLTNGTAIDVTVSWGGQTPSTRTFRVNKMLFLSDMTDVISLSVSNNGQLSETVRIYSF